MQSSKAIQQDFAKEKWIPFTANFSGGNSYKYEISSEATVDETKFAVVKAFEDFKVKEGQSAVTNYKWDVHNPVRKVNKDTGRVEMVMFIVCDQFFLDKQQKVSNIIQDYLVKDAAAVPEKKTISKSAKKASSCEGCKELKQKFDFQYAQQQEFIIQLQQSIAQLQQVNAQQQQINAQLLSGINSVVLPMQKIHRRVLLHYLRDRICILLGRLPGKEQPWGEFLQGIINSPDQMSVLVNMDAAVLLFVMTEATIGGLNNAAHSGERGEIALAVLAVQDNSTRAMWERVFVLVYGDMPELNY